MRNKKARKFLYGINYVGNASSAPLVTQGFLNPKDIVIVAPPGTENYCICKGTKGKDLTDFYIGKYLLTNHFSACDGGEENCPYGGWVHKNCFDDLKCLSQEEADRIDSWYCDACRVKPGERKESFGMMRDGDS